LEAYGEGGEHWSDISISEVVAFRVDRGNPPLLGAKRSFRMGVAGLRFTHVKRNLSGRAAVVAVLEDWQVICSVVVTVGSMIMLGILLYNELQQ
jgi:hypothetical protein